MSPLTIRLPSISLEQSIKIEREVQKAVLEFPEVQMMVSKIGRTELANDPQEPNESDSVAMLHPIETWTTASTMAGLKERVRERLAKVPGANFLISQPIQQRVDELISGVRAEVTVKLFGPDLDELRLTGDEIAGVLGTIRGVKDLKVEQLFGQPYITIDIDRGKIARHGINVSDVREVIATAIGGEAATRVYEENRRFNLVVRFPEQYRNSIETIGNIRLTAGSGAFIPLSDLGTIRMHEGPGRINRDHLQRYLPVSFNTHGRDIGEYCGRGAAADGPGGPAPGRVPCRLGRIVRKYAAGDGPHQDYCPDHHCRDLLAPALVVFLAQAGGIDHSAISRLPSSAELSPYG